MDPLVLIADRSTQRAQHLANFFLRAGFNVERVTNGAACVGKLRHIDPDVLFIDLDVPLADDEMFGAGESVLSYIREHNEISVPAFVLVSGDAPRRELSMRSRTPPAFCFSRPIHQDEILKSLTGYSLPTQSSEQPDL